MSEQVLRIGIDIDDVLFESARRSIEMYNKQYGTKLTLHDWYNFSDPKVWSKAWGSDDMSVLVKRVVETFSDKAFETVSPIKGAEPELRRLQEDGHQLFAITGRSESIRPQTMGLLDTSYPGIFHDDSLFFTDHFEHDGVRASKADVALSLDIDYFVEDLPDHANALARVGIGTILFDPGYPWNQTGVSSEVTRISTWSAIGAFLDDEVGR